MSTTMIPCILDDKERSLILAHRQAIADEIYLNNTEAKKLSPEQLRENYLVYNRKAYDKRHDKVIVQRRASYMPTGRPIDRSRKSQESIILIKINHFLDVINRGEHNAF